MVDSTFGYDTISQTNTHIYKFYYANLHTQLDQRWRSVCTNQMILFFDSLHSMFRKYYKLPVVLLNIGLHRWRKLCIRWYSCIHKAYSCDDAHGYYENYIMEDGGQSRMKWMRTHSETERDTRNTEKKWIKMHLFFALGFDSTFWKYSNNIMRILLEIGYCHGCSHFGARKLFATYSLNAIEHTIAHNDKAHTHLQCTTTTQTIAKAH